MAATAKLEVRANTDALVAWLDGVQEALVGVGAQLEELRIALCAPPPITVETESPRPSL